MDQFLEVAENVIVYKIRSAWHEMARLYNELASEHGITLSMGFILLTLNEKYGTPVTKIAPLMGMEPNSLSRVLKKMEIKEIVFRRKDDADKRKVFICLTENGKKMRDIALAAVFKLDKAIVSGLSKDQLSAFMEVINRVSKSVEETKSNLKKEAL